MTVTLKAADGRTDTFSVMSVSSHGQDCEGSWLGSGASVQSVGQEARSA